jgi:ABC-type polysaccharide/polyol phosphate export permease
MAALILGLGLLYSRIFHQPFKEFLAFLGAGLVTWYFLSNLMLEACSVATEADSHLKAVPLPLPIFAARVVYRNLIIFLHNLVVVVIMMLILQRGVSPAFLLVLPGVAIFCLFGFGLGVLLGPVSARFRDVPQVMATLIQLAFFVTPIFWRPSQISTSSPIVQMNPLFHMVEIIRQPLLGSVPHPSDYAVSLVLLAVVLTLAVFNLAYTRRKIFLWL